MPLKRNASTALARLFKDELCWIRYPKQHGHGGRRRRQALWLAVS
jgi:hypothetical protein